MQNQVFFGFSVFYFCSTYRKPTARFTAAEIQDFCRRDGELPFRSNLSAAASHAPSLFSLLPPFFRTPHPLLSFFFAVTCLIRVFSPPRVTPSTVFFTIPSPNVRSLSPAAFSALSCRRCKLFFSAAEKQRFIDRKCRFLHYKVLTALCGIC